MDFEDVSGDYFQQPENDEDLPIDEEKKTKSKSFWKKLFG